MNLKDVDNPKFLPTDPHPNSYLRLATQCHMLSVEWQRRGAAWERMAKNVREKAKRDSELTELSHPLEYE